MSGEDYGAPVNEWINVVRRAQLGRTTKFIALLIATYADPDGTRIFPGVARLAVQSGADYRTVRRALSALRSVGLIEVARRGSRRAGKSDEYRLILAADLLERCDVPAPAAEQLAIQKLTEQQRTPGSTGHRSPVKRPVDNRPAVTDHRSPAPRVNGFTGQGTPVLQGTGAPPPSIDPYLEDQPPSEATDLRDGVQVGDQVASATKSRNRAGGTGSSGQFDTRTRNGTERARQAQHDALNEWMRQHPEAAGSLP